MNEKVDWPEGTIKTVGRRQARVSPEQALTWNFDWLQLVHPAVLRQPRGVFRFRSWDELEKWNLAHLTTKT